MSEEIKLTTTAGYDLDTAIQAGRKQVQVHEIAGRKPFVTYPKDQDLKILDDPKLANPRFFTAAPNFRDPAGFCEYVNKYKDADTRIFFDEKGVFVAVFDYHRIGEARHGDHTAVLTLVPSPEWIAWTGSNDKGMRQDTFAEFIEDNIQDITKPDGKTMLDAASGLIAKKETDFRSAVNLNNGSMQFTFDEKIEGTIKGSPELMPTAFEVALRPFIGAPRYPIDARLRYRIDSSKLQLRFKLMALEKLLEHALTQEVGMVQNLTTIVPALGNHNAEAFKRGF